jgi:hypothetical protein
MKTKTPLEILVIEFVALFLLVTSVLFIAGEDMGIMEKIDFPSGEQLAVGLVGVVVAGITCLIFLGLRIEKHLYKIHTELKVKNEKK